MKKILKDFIKLLALTSLVLGSAGAAIQVNRLQSLSQVGEGPDCGFYAAWGANCLAQDGDLAAARSILTNRDAFNAYRTRAKAEVQNYIVIRNKKRKEQKIIIEAADRVATNIDGDHIDRAVLPLLSNKNRITIIDNTTSINAFVSGELNYQSIVTGVQQYKRDHTPHAVVVNIGGHWVSYGIRFEHGQTTIFHTNSCNINEQILNAGDGTLANKLYRLFNGDDTFLPPAINEQLYGLERRTFQQPIINYQTAKYHLDNILSRSIAQGIYSPEFYEQYLRVYVEILQANNIIEANYIEQKFPRAAQTYRGGAPAAHAGAGAAAEAELYDEEAEELEEDYEQEILAREAQAAEQERLAREAQAVAEERLAREAQAAEQARLAREAQAAEQERLEREAQVDQQVQEALANARLEILSAELAAKASNAEQRAKEIAEKENASKKEIADAKRLAAESKARADKALAAIEAELAAKKTVDIQSAERLAAAQEAERERLASKQAAKRARVAAIEAARVKRIEQERIAREARERAARERARVATEQERIARERAAAQAKQRREQAAAAEQARREAEQASRKAAQAARQAAQCSESSGGSGLPGAAQTAIRKHLNYAKKSLSNPKKSKKRYLQAIQVVTQHDPSFSITIPAKLKTADITSLASSLGISLQ